MVLTFPYTRSALPPNATLTGKRSAQVKKPALFMQAGFFTWRRTNQYPEN